MVEAREQRFKSGVKIFVGEMIEAVSFMKCTPKQLGPHLFFVVEARESTKSAISCISDLIIVQRITAFFSLLLKYFIYDIVHDSLLILNKAVKNKIVIRTYRYRALWNELTTPTEIKSTPCFATSRIEFKSILRMPQLLPDCW